MTKSSVNHYLLTLDVGDMHLHGYVMCRDKIDLEKVMTRMIDEAEREWPGRLVLPIVLSTQLSTGTDMVRRIVSESWPEAKQAMETAADFHCSIWAIPAGCPDDRCLMELH